ncbi:MAG: RsmD family RNA methyltransferase [Bacteroidetes bacterium]|nr:RsmD family RNA methyltransferase [Bacteroidota bacterium]
MRITGGHLKGYKISSGFPDHVRPTTDMMRESLFNKLQHSCGIEDQKVLDLFSGSGIVSLEFLSRNAASVISVDRDFKNIKIQNEIKSNLKIDNWQIQKSDVFSFIQKLEEKFDIIFADPPYDLKQMLQLPELLIPKLAPDGILILEHRPGMAFHNAVETKKQGSSALSIFANSIA